MAENYNWSAIAKSDKYLELKRKKRVFLFGWWLASTVYYFLLPVLSGYFPDLFKIKLVGVINFGYPLHPVPVRRGVFRGHHLHKNGQ